MRQAKQADTVFVHFTGKTKNGRIFTSTAGLAPLEFVIGEGKALKGLERGVIGMQAGERRIIEVPPEDGFGRHHTDLVATIRRELLPRSETLRVGQRVQVKKNAEQPVEMEITALDGDHVTVDANHPLAGETLVLEVQLVEIR
jgi:peptidylprolyl isomerase